MTNNTEQEQVKRFTSDDVKVAFENGYAAAMSVAEISEEAEQRSDSERMEPVSIDWEQLQNFWRNNSSVDWDELESAVKCAVVTPVRTKDLTDDELREIHHLDQFGLFCDYDEFEQIARAVIAKDREKNK